MIDPLQEDRITALLDAMTIEEQVSLLAGRDFWHTVPVERLQIPSIKLSDGPNGARGGGALVGGVAAAAFPVAIALASSWNLALIDAIGEALALEAKSKGARVLLAPTVNIHRSTLNGRNFECYAEDPFLTAEIAVAYITGLQRLGIAATVKHFVGNDSEYQRTTISSDIDERTLREIYLPPFEAAVSRGGSWALMTSYNRLNGSYVSEHATLIDGLLRNEWGFDGLVMSDWFGTRATAEALSAGLDLEMPGPGRYRGDKLLAAFRAGQVSGEALRQSARRVLRLIARVGAFEDPVIADERADDRPETRALIRRAGAEGIVLLKNDGILPLSPRAPLRIAVIGPNAKTAQIMGGGSSQLNPHYSISPFEGLAAALPEGVTLAYELGCTNHRLLPLVRGNVTIDVFDGTAFDGPVKHRITASDASFMFMGEETTGFSVRDFSARASFVYTPDQGGDHAIGLVASGPCRLFIDGALAVDGWDFRRGQEYFGSACAEVVATHHLVAGVAYDVVVETRSSDLEQALDVTVLRVGLAPVLGEEAVNRAIALAEQSDVALIFAGLNGEWDGEGQDRPHIDLPGRQNDLIAKVSAANPRTVVVLQTGCPVTMPWLAEVAAVLQAWYPGQEAGHAIADVLLGEADPGGRLPQTFPRRLEDDPTAINYPGENGRVRYGEGLFVGYRYYDKKKIAPLFPFGHGLSYTTFDTGELRLSCERLAPGTTFTASIDVTNTGQRAGSTVVQFYVSDPGARVVRPDKELKGFVKLHLAPGETRSATATFDMRSLAFYDTALRAWVAEAGLFEILAGFSSADLRATSRLSLTDDWTGPAPGHSWPASLPSHPLSKRTRHGPDASALPAALQRSPRPDRAPSSWRASSGMASPMSRRSALSTTTSPKPSGSSGSDGLSAKSGHFGLAMAEQQPDRVVEIAKALGMDWVVIPFLPVEERPADAAGWAAVGQRLGALGQRFGREGLRRRLAQPRLRVLARSTTAPCRSSTFSGIISIGRRISPGWSRVEATRSLGSSAIAAAFPWSTSRISHLLATSPRRTGGPMSAPERWSGPSCGASARRPGRM